MTDIKNQPSFSDYARRELTEILHKSQMELHPEFALEIGSLIRELFDPRPDRLFKKPPADFGDRNIGGFNILPSTNTSTYITDTLVVFCTGGDNLLNRIVDMIVMTSQRQFRTVLFITSKWDEAVLSGSNVSRWGNLCDLGNNGTKFCFILASLGGLSRIFSI